MVLRASWFGADMYRTGICALLALLLFPALTAAGVSKIEDVRIADRGDSTRIVFDLSSPAKHKVFVLSNPHRVVLDIERCKANGKLSSVKAKSTLLKSLRYAQKSPQKLRVVLDMHTAVAPKSWLLGPANGKGHRLVLDLSSKVKRPGVKPVLAMPDTSHGRRDAIIAIDAGHGGKDPGAIGRKGTYEKVIVLSIAKRLKNLIDKERGMRAVMIRNGDTYVPLRTRIRKASRLNADMFISIHADASVNRNARGSSVYVLSQRGATSEAARILAQRENAADKIGGVSLDDKDKVLKSVLVDLSQTATIDASIDLAEDILHELGAIGNLLHNRVEQAGFAVLKSPDIPSVLVETAFISNPQEEQRLRTRAHQQKLAAAILKGIRRYLKDHAQSDMLLAASGSGSRHVIRRGETLSTIANYYQIGVGELRRANALKSDKIRAGQVLMIPGSTGT
ncbi:MAG: AMIN domain-containing protein [Proteobacteria bacterium]|nr:AMIN domain-containing protein [Pseudomonadota bacterium]